jgi:hypothetical protein
MSFHVTIRRGCLMPSFCPSAGELIQLPGTVLVDPEDPFAVFNATLSEVTAVGPAPTRLLRMAAAFTARGGQCMGRQVSLA